MSYTPFFPSTMCAQLPLELFATIFDCLHYDSAALQSCSTVSTTFRHLAQRKLFYQVSLTIPPMLEFKHKIPPFGSAKVLFELLRKSPHLVDYVRRLDISDNDSIRMGPSMAPWDETFIHVLSLFKYLTVISFRLVSYNPILWRSMPPRMQSTILHALQRPTVTRIEIFNTIEDFPLSLLLKSRGLKYLRVFDDDHSYTLPKHTSFPAHPIALKHLELKGFASYFGPAIFTDFHNSQSIDLSSLEHLFIRGGGLLASELWTKEIEELLQNVAGSLKSFHYFLPRPAARLSRDADLSIPSNLECLRIPLYLYHLDFAFDRGCHSRLINILCRIPPTSRLKTIKIYFSFRFSNTLSHEPEITPGHLSNLDWTMLDAWICSLSYLHSCHIFIRLPTRTAPKVLAGIRLPFTQSRGILRVTYWFCSHNYSSMISSGLF
jgi:hypothetical protein